MTHLHTIKFKERTYDVVWEAENYRPERRYLANGDPGYPAEGGFEGLVEMWTVLNDKNEHPIKIDVLPILYDQNRERIDEFEEEVLEEIKKVCGDELIERYNL